MVFGLKIQNQLLIVVVFLLFGLASQGYVTNVAQDNNAVIQNTKEAYLERDGEVANSLNTIVLQTNELVNFQLEEYIYGLLHNDSDSDISIINQFEDNFESTLRLLLSRQNSGYSLSNTSLREILFVYSADDQYLNDITNLVDSSNNGSYKQLSFIQTQVFSVLQNLKSQTNSLKNQYHHDSHEFYDSIANLTGSVSSVLTQLIQLENNVITNTDNQYVRDVLLRTNQLQHNLNLLQGNISLIQQEFHKEDASDQAIFNVISNFISTSNNSQSIYDSFNNLQQYPLNATHQNIVDTMNATVENIVFSEMNAVFNSLDDFGDIRNEIATFQTSQFINAFETAKEGILSAKSIYDNEHFQFLVLYNDLQEQLISDSQTVVLFITGIIGVIVLVLALPTVIRIRRSTSKISRNLNRVAKGDLSFETKGKTGDDEFGQIEKSFNSFVSDIHEILYSLQGSSKNLAGISEELAAGTEEALSSVDEVSQTIDTISSSANQQSRLLDSIDKTMRELQQEIRAATTQIEEASYQVTKISNRTNILGLNATINAAKSEQGSSGFRIVADEIRELAKTSKKSGQQITLLVEEIIFNVQELMGKVRDDVDFVKDLAKKTAEGAQTSNSSTDEQVIMNQEISETASDLAELAASIDQIVSGFKLQ